MNADEMTLDQLGDEITTLAAHIHAAMCRWLMLVAEFDARDGWAPWGCKSCAHWIAWRCSITPVTAREHVRVARRLADLPLVRAAFSRGELSYSKVRALTRVEDVEREAELLGMARSCTAAQLDKAVRGYRRVVRAQAARAHDERFLAFEHDDDGSMIVRGRLPRDEAALVMKALDAARDAAARKSADAGEDASAEAPAAAARYADALVDVAEAALAAGRAEAPARSGGDRYQVVVHVDSDALAGDGAGRSELEDGAPIAAETARRLCCDASIVALVEREGRPLSVGRKTRSIPPSLRRALRSRDGGCRFPGCTNHRWVDAHHIQHWADGGRTEMDNLVHLCRHHHRLVHEGGFIVERRGGALVFRRPDGRLLRRVPRARRGDHDHLVAVDRRSGRRMTPATPVPDWYGDGLNLPDAVDALLMFAPLRE